MIANPIGPIIDNEWLRLLFGTEVFSMRSGEGRTSSASEGSRNEVGIPKTVSAAPNCGKNVAQTVRAPIPRLQGSEGLGMADESQACCVQPNLLPHDVRRRRSVSSSPQGVERVPGGDRGCADRFDPRWRGAELTGKG